VREHIKSLLIVAVITAFVWLAADQNVQEEQSFNIPVRVATPDPNRYVALVTPPKQAMLRVSMSGRRRYLQAFADLVRTQGVFEATLDESKPTRQEPQLLSTADDLLKKIRGVAESHLIVKSVTPAEVTVLIDEFVEITDLSIQPNFGDLRVSATCAPSQVTARLPRSALGLLPADRVLRPNMAGPVKEELKSAPDNPDFKLIIPLVLESELSAPITFLPDKVTVAGVVEGLQAKATKGPVPISFTVPLQVQERFTIAFEPSTNLLQNVEITGPVNLLGRLNPRDIRAYVEVLVEDMDEPGKKITRPVQFILPPGFTLPPDAIPPSITFTLVARPTATPSGP
jgi:hypothetical protein